MTQAELDQLENDVQNGLLSEDDFVSRLRDEVSILHRELSDEEISNMFQMQLKVMAIDEVLKDEIETAPITHPRGIGPAEQAEQNEKGKEDKAFSAELEKIKALMEKLNGERQKSQSADSNASSKPEKGNQDNKPDNGQQQDQKQNSDKKEDNSQQDKDKSKQNQDKQNQNKQDKNNDKSKSKSNRYKWWWTYQIVPDWNEWMKDEAEEKVENPKDDDVIDMHEQPDGTFSANIEQ